MTVPSSDQTLPDGVRVTTGHGGLPVVQVDVPACTGEVYLHGAHVTSWRPLGSEVLWVSDEAVYRPGKAIRGGVPICFPWFADGPDGTATPAHGFARTTEWGLVGATTDGQWVELIFELADKLMVLNYGEVIANGDPKDVRDDPMVRKVYLGRGQAHA